MTQRTDVKIIPMDKENAEFVAQIEAECFSQPWSREAFLKELENPDAISLAAVSDTVCGFINAHKILDEVYINNIAVKNGYRRLGIGSALLDKLEKYAGKVSLITLEVRKSNFPAISLYEKHGYQKVGERKNFYSFPTEDAVLMTKYFVER
ncbi:MAG: ribosomal protein S18-alanine N-acetyltransferase [Oscillospiraceae bacterium]|nr:ribosomal protein S18-alanine N-acetyltransferase [Oscillospiraceae bacterium]